MAEDIFEEKEEKTKTETKAVKEEVEEPKSSPIRNLNISTKEFEKKTKGKRQSKVKSPPS